MLKELQLEETDPENFLISGRKALQFLFEESVAEGKKDIANVLKEVLDCCEDLMQEQPECVRKQSDAVLTFYFVRAVLGLSPEKLKPLIAFLRWMSVIPNHH